MSERGGEDERASRPADVELRLATVHWDPTAECPELPVASTGADFASRPSPELWARHDDPESRCRICTTGATAYGVARGRQADHQRGGLCPHPYVRRLHRQAGSRVPVVARRSWVLYIADVRAYARRPWQVRCCRDNREGRDQTSPGDADQIGGESDPAFPGGLRLGDRSTASRGRRSLGAALVLRGDDDPRAAGGDHRHVAVHGALGGRAVGSRSRRRAMVVRTTRFSAIARAAPRQRRIPPPKGIQS